MQQALVALALVLAPVAAASDAGQIFFVGAGVEQYDDPSIAPLRYAVDDVTAVAALLRDAGVPEGNLTLLTSEAEDRLQRPTKFAVLHALQRVRERARAIDTLIFFFAGHGLQQGDDAYLLTADAVREQVTDTALAMKTVQSTMSRFEARQVLFIIDACRNDPDAGRANTDAALDESFARNLRPRLVGPDPAVAALLLACDVGERAWEMPDRRHGAFTWFLLEGLRGAAANPAGNVTVKSLADFLRREVPAWARRAGRAQSPSLTNPTGGDFVLLRGPLRPAPVTGETLVRSVPEGAEVLLDGRPLGRTPVRLTLPVGPCRLTLRGAGWADETLTLDIRAGEIVEAPPVTLRRPTGRVFVTTTPAGAEILLEGRPTGVRTPGEIETPVGAVTIGVSLEGYLPATRAVETVAGRLLRLAPWDLEPAGKAPPGAPAVEKLICATILERDLGAIEAVFERSRTLMENGEWGLIDGPSLLGVVLEPGQWAGFNMGLDPGTGHLAVVQASAPSARVAWRARRPDGSFLVEASRPAGWLEGVAFSPETPAPLGLEVGLTGGTEPSLVVFALLRNSRGWNVPPGNLQAALQPFRELLDEFRRDPDGPTTLGFNREPNQFALHAGIVKPGESLGISNVVLGAGHRVVLSTCDAFGKEPQLNLTCPAWGEEAVDYDQDEHRMTGLVFSRAGQLAGVNLTLPRAEGPSFCVLGTFYITGLRGG